MDLLSLLFKVLDALSNAHNSSWRSGQQLSPNPLSSESSSSIPRRSALRTWLSRKCKSCCSIDLLGTSSCRNGLSASQIASASLASFFCNFKLRLDNLWSCQPNLISQCPAHAPSNARPRALDDDETRPCCKKKSAAFDRRSRFQRPSRTLWLKPTSSHHDAMQSSCIDDRKLPLGCSSGQSRVAS